MNDNTNLQPDPPPRSERDGLGRFQRGNQLGRLGGNPNLKRQNVLQAAVRAAATPEAVIATLGMLHEQALAGDVQAAGLWLQRVLGKPHQASSGASIDLPPLDTAAGIVEALRRVAVAAAEGAMAPEESNAILAALRAVADVDTLAKIEEHIRVIEARRGSQ